LPGTLLGFYPGVISSYVLPKPKKEVNTTYGYLKRYDGTWLDPYKYIPYPIKPYLSLADFEIQEIVNKEVILLKHSS
jgi:hypothetical protein